MTTSTEQIQAIHAMLDAGHRGIRLERHTFWIWGLTGAFLILSVPQIFSHARFADGGDRILYQNLFIAVCLFAAGILDWHWTRRIRERKGETLPFVQRQITRVWWLLIGLIVAINIGMNLYGGGYLFFGVALVLVGIALYVHGLFSRQALSWGGGLLIVVGLALAAASPPIRIQEWTTASALGLGLPILSLLVQGERRSPLKEFGLSLAWIALVLLPVATAVALTRPSAKAEGAVIDYRDYLQQSHMMTGNSAVRLPAGTRIPLRLEMEGDTLVPEGEVMIPMRLLRPATVTPGEDRLRFDGPWRRLEEFRLHGGLAVAGDLLPGDGARLRLHLTLNFGD